MLLYLVHLLDNPIVTICHIMSIIPIFECPPSINWCVSHHDLHGSPLSPVLLLMTQVRQKPNVERWNWWRTDMKTPPNSNDYLIRISWEYHQQYGEQYGNIVNNMAISSTYNQQFLTCPLNSHGLNGH